MKRTLYLSLLALLLIGTNVLAQTPSSGQNYIMQTVVKRGGHKVKDSLSSFAVDSVNRTISYFDGLGRPIQTVQWQASPSKKDVISINVYDALGREAVKYLPYADSVGNDGSYRTTALAKQAAYYGNATWDTSVVKTPYPFSKAIFEPSPLNRLLEQGASGATWQPYSGSISGSGHTVRAWQGTNGTGEVLLWSNTSTGAESTTTYTAGTLYKTVTKDENWTSGKAGTVAEFKDLDGRVVLRRQWTSNTDSLSTYYTYDVFGNLSYVIPPAVTALSFDEVSDSNFSNYIYAYHYDGHQRLTEKHVPAKGWEWIVYNVNDQAVLTQDAVLKANNQWLFTKYDALGRVVVTGLLNSSSSQTTWQGSFDSQTYLWEAKDPLNGSGAGTGYTNVSLPTSSISAYHTISYYDDYYFHGNSFGGPNGNQVIAERTRGLQTGQKTAILGTGTMLLSVNYFDGEGRVLQVRATNHLGTDTINNAYNFAGEMVSSTRRHRVNGTTTTIADSLIYDHVGRKISTRENINNQGQVVLNRLDYNGIGQLRKKNLHSTNSGASFMQYSILAYNERGWLKKSTSPEFRMQLDYQDGTHPQYNGNIANQHWGTSLANEFVYQYDPLDRLTNAVSTGISMSEVLAYDVMGNITKMNRDGAGDANYSYTGNQLNSISGGGLTTGSYVYDATGNATTDGRLGTTVTYNHLNLPTSFTKGGGTPISLTYVYDADGTKLQKINAVTSDTTNYIDGIQYTNHHLDFIQNEEGRATNNSGTYNYQYDLKDHLGNVRFTFDIYAGAIRPLQEDNYYAFGLRKGVIGGSNNYLYNGKEQQPELGLTSEDGQYDYGARFYDPYIGRFTGVDPIADKFTWVTPYNYAENEPVGSIDLWGLQRWMVNGRERNLPMPEWRTRARAIGFAIRYSTPAMQIGSIERGSTNISSVAGRYARHFADATGTNKEIGSLSNALRHGIWSSMIRSKFNEEISTKATNAHEGVGIAENQYVDMSMPFNVKGQEGQRLADHIVDVLNNNIGMGIAEANPKAGTKELALLVLSEFKNNGLWTFSTDKEGNVTISRTKISQSLYDQGVENMNSLDDNGFTPEEKRQLKREKKNSGNWEP